MKARTFLFFAFVTIIVTNKFLVKGLLHGPCSPPSAAVGWVGARTPRAPPGSCCPWIETDYSRGLPHSKQNCNPSISGRRTLQCGHTLTRKVPQYIQCFHPGCVVRLQEG